MRAISLKVHTGESNLPAAILSLATLLQAAQGEAEQAAIHYELWRLDHGQEAHRQQAAAAYQALYAQTPNVEYKWRYEALSGETLSAPPPLPPLPAIVTSETTSLEALAAQVDTIYNKDT